MRGRESVFVSVAGECEASEGQRPVHPGSEHGPGWGVFYPETAETPQSPTLVFRSLSLGLLSSSPPARSPLWTSHGHVSLADGSSRSSDRPLQRYREWPGLGPSHGVPRLFP